MVINNSQNQKIPKEDQFKEIGKLTEFYTES